MIVRIHDGNEVYETEADDCGSKPYVAVKKCRMLRSGIQLYTKDEVPKELFGELPEEKRNKEIFKVYRRPEAVVKHLKDFNYIPLANNHPKVDITPDNRKEYEVGRAGGQATLETLDDGNVYVANDLIFDDRKAFEDYKNGKRELSIGLQAVWVVSDSPEYDFEVVDFANVNHVALVTRGRAGHEAKVMDTMAAVSRSIDKNFRNNGTGGYGMNFLKMFGIGKNKDGAADFCLSKAVMDCASKLVVDGITEDEANKAVAGVMDYVVRLGDSEDRKILTGMVRDALTGAADLNGADDEAKKKVADAIDTLYKKCQDADDEKAKAAIEDALKDKKDDKKDDESKDGKDDKKDDKGDEDKGANKDGCGSQKDTAEVVAEAVAKALDAQKLDDKIEAAVAKALGIGKGKAEIKGQQADSAGSSFDAEDLAMNAWNR